MMRHRSRSLRPTLTALVMLVAMAGAAGAFDGWRLPGGTEKGPNLQAHHNMGRCRRLPA